MYHALSSSHNNNNIDLAMYITKGENYDLWGFNNLKDEIKEAVANGNEATNLGTKDGLTLFHLDKGTRWSQYVYLQRNRDKQIVGIISLNKKKERKIGYGVYAVYLKRGYRGRGLGTVLYLGAAHVLKKIHSSTCIGEMAVRTWRSLGHYHRLDMYQDPYARNPKKVKYEWDTKYPIVNGKSIDQQSSYFQFVITKTRTKKA
jgi:GNAT superfamily N-acetyltransferase